ncbi:hypothetical protein ACFTZ8_24555 [Streptomyces fungicidicus]|uniref:hypothetical protein n=1 Tax=Streptomyces fungicidicus TaxID=68203 RepID=UPI0033F1AB7D
MTDASRRPGDVPAPEGHPTAPGVHDPDPRVSRTEADRTAVDAGRTSPLPGDPPATATHHDGARTPAAGTHYDGDRTAAATTGTHREADRTAAAGTLHGGDRTPAAGTYHDGDLTTATGTLHGGDRTAAAGTEHHDGDRTSGARLLAAGDSDKLSGRLRHAVAGFVDEPRDAVQEADLVLRELTERLTDSVTERRRALRQSWQTDGADGADGAAAGATAADTERLRLALRDYRELAERLLRV